MSRTNRFVLLAFKRGYRVTDDGVLLNSDARRLGVRRHGTQRFPTLSLRVGYGETASAVYGIPVHRLAAYCFHGEAMFAPGIEVRHLNGNTEDISRENIALGTRSQNEYDKPPEVRRRAARLARAAQGKRALNARFTDEQVATIRERHAAGERQASIGRDLDVTRQCIYRIIRGMNYAGG